MSDETKLSEGLRARPPQRKKARQVGRGRDAPRPCELGPPLPRPAGPLGPTVAHPEPSADIGIELIYNGEVPVPGTAGIWYHER